MLRHIHLRTNYGVEVKFDIDLDLANHAEAWIDHHLQNGVCYESEVAHVLMRCLRPGDFCIDVGANVGFFSIMMAKLVGDTGTVLAYEPGNNNLPALRKNLQGNGCSTISPLVIEEPLWCDQEKRTFYLSSDSSGGNAMWDPGKWWENEKTRQAPEAYEVETTTLDLEVAPNADDRQKVRLIKIDTEGAEQQILEGAKVLLREHKPPFIVVELNPFGLKQFGNDNETLRAFMRDYGYHLFLLHNDGALPSLVPRNSTVTHMNNGNAVMNALFSNLDAVGEVWSRVPHG